MPGSFCYTPQWSRNINGRRTATASLASGFAVLWLVLGGIASAGTPGRIYIRANQVGYLPDEPKLALVMATRPMNGYTFEIVEAESGSSVWGPMKLGENRGDLGNFQHHYPADFSPFEEPGRYKLVITGTNVESLSFPIGEKVYEHVPDLLLGYIRQQRCGYNPFFDRVCHQKDGKTMYGPMPDSTYMDVTGGWHDAGDHLRYLLTSGNTVGRLLFAYRENRGKFSDRVDERGRPGSNGIPDILDEARWGLEWMLKMHPKENELFHQVGDDRDHIGFKLPYADSADYGWGPGSYRVVYYANGKPQGLFKHRNTSTGIANLAGRYAAAMAMAYDIWMNDLDDHVFAETCLKAGREVYEMGKRQPGCQEGTPCLAPYRYYEGTYADDMEWGAAELYRVTDEQEYLEDSKRYARQIGPLSWMGKDTARHYEYYPFMNLGHYSLYFVVDESFRETLTQYYRTGIEAVARRASSNPYGIGIPLIWCSNNLAAAFISQCILYEKMTGDTTYRELMTAHRDWLLGRNPWGVTQFVGVPEGGVSPRYPHSAVTLLTDRLSTGGMNDGPVYPSIFRALKGIHLSKEDELAEFQSELAVYHDDLWDYSTNEPTLDGTAEALVFLSFLASGN